jgi:hypothetical protein
MNPLREHWLLEDGLAFLNHGSFGACPRVVVDEQSRLRAEMERNPVRFLWREIGDRLDAARAELARFIGADAEELAFVANATTAVNSMLRSFELQPGDEILVTDHGYNACNNVAAECARRSGAKVITARIPLPIAGPEQAVTAIVAAVTPRYSRSTASKSRSSAGALRSGDGSAFPRMPTIRPTNTSASPMSSPPQQNPRGVDQDQCNAGARTVVYFFTAMKRALVLLLPLLLAAARAEDFQGADHPLEYDHEPISYSASQPHDPVSVVQQKIMSGELKLKWDEKFGYLPALLDAFGAKKSSQVLVMSKTSLQRRNISPDNPRSVFFSDDVYLGYIPGAPVIEISSVDPQLGGTFYFIEQEQVRKPKFTRSNDCLSCHGGQRTLGVPGHFVRSVVTDASGEMISLEEVRDITQCTPLKDRWGGYYVTGKSGSQFHRGNLIGEKDLMQFKREPAFKSNLTDLSPFFDTSKYHGTGSDITALMVLEHQVHMHNYIARLNIEAKLMLAAYGHVRYIRAQVDAFLRYLLFTEEFPLTQKIEGNPEYVRDFEAHAIRDSKGRSLRELDLKTRLFKYPCSFLIYSPSFDAIEPQIKAIILQKLHDILTGKNDDAQFARLKPEDRKAILEILIETKKTLPDYWRKP